MSIQDQLEIIRASGEIEFYDLDPGRGIANIGRDPENDIVIDSPGVAPFHAVLDHRQKPYRLMVLSQAGGTTLGGQTLPPHVSREVHHWDTIELDGHVVILLEGGAAAARPAPATAPSPVPQPVPPAPGLRAAPVPPPPATVPGPASAAAALARRRPVSLPTLPPDQPDEIIVTELSGREWTIEVEQTATLQVTVANGGPIVAMFEVWVDGLDGDWVTISPPQVNLNEGERATVSVTIAPPRLPTSRAGVHPFAVLVTSPNYPGRCSQRGATLTINPYYEFAVGDLSPKQQTVSWSKRSGEATIPVENKGNSSAVFRLEGTDDERACSFEFRVPGETARLATQAEMRLSPEETAAIPVHITPYSRRLIGLRKRIHSLTITTNLLEAGQTPRMVLGQLKSAPLIGLWHLLLIFLLLMIGTVYFFMPGPNPRLWREQGIQVMATDNQIALNYDASRFKSSDDDYIHASRFKSLYDDYIHILNRINGLFLRLKLERKLQGAPETTYEIVEASLPDRPSGVAKDAPQWNVVYRLTVENWLTLLYQPLEQQVRYTVSVTEVLPTITASITMEIQLGQSATVTWTQQYAERLVLKTEDGLVVETTDEPEPTGSYKVQPEADTTYIFEAHNLYTKEEGPATADATVKVIVPPPVILAFIADPREVVGGTPVALNWRVSGADTVSLESDDLADRPMSVGLEGLISKQPMKNTRYTLRAVREAPQATATAEAYQDVVVQPTPSPPTIVFFTAEPNKLVRGDKGQVELKWSIIGTTTNVEISGPSLASPISNLQPEGTISVAVKESTLFVLTAFNQEQKESATVQVEVQEPTPTPPPPAEIEEFIISFPPEVKDLGGGRYQVPVNTDVTFSWRTNSAAKKVTFTDFTGAAVPGSVPIGSTVRRITAEKPLRKDFQLVAENEAGSLSKPKTISVDVVDRDPPDPPFNVDGREDPEEKQNRITWQWMEDPKKTDIVGFRVYRDDKLDGSYKLIPGADENALPKGTNSFADSVTPTCGRAYYVTVVYRDVEGKLKELPISSTTTWFSSPCP